MSQRIVIGPRNPREIEREGNSLKYKMTTQTKYRLQIFVTEIFQRFLSLYNILFYLKCQDFSLEIVIVISLVNVL